LKLGIGAPNPKITPTWNLKDTSLGRAQHILRTISWDVDISQRYFHLHFTKEQLENTTFVKKVHQLIMNSRFPRDADGELMEWSKHDNIWLTERGMEDLKNEAKRLNKKFTSTDEILNEKIAWRRTIVFDTRSRLIYMGYKWDAKRTVIMSFSYWRKMTLEGCLEFMADNAWTHSFEDVDGPEEADLMKKFRGEGHGMVPTQKEPQD